MKEPEFRFRAHASNSRLGQPGPPHPFRGPSSRSHAPAHLTPAQSDHRWAWGQAAPEAPQVEVTLLTTSAWDSPKEPFQGLPATFPQLPHNTGQKNQAEIIIMNLLWGNWESGWHTEDLKRFAFKGPGQSWEYRCTRGSGPLA